MNSRERVLLALDHREPDRVPFDLGSTQVTGISIRAYERLREHLGLDRREPQICDLIQQLAYPHQDVLDRLQVDTRGLYPLNANTIPLPVGGRQWRETHEQREDVWLYTDEWGLTHSFPKKDGLYYSQVGYPLGGAEVSPEQVDALPLPSGDEPWRLEGLGDKAREFRKQGKAVVLRPVCAGLVEMGERVRGMENFLVDLLANPPSAERLMDRFLEIKMRYWRRALGELGDLLDVVMEADDYGTQESQLVSPEIFRSLVKPRLKRLIEHIRNLAPRVKILFHSCGAVRPIIPDFIEIGIDALNPVHVNAEGMEPAGLKRDFGRELCFWGGGIETQSVLPHGTAQEVKDSVRRNAEALAPGGGWVFNTIHNIQPDVPPENLMAMWEALREYGTYA